MFFYQLRHAFTRLLREPAFTIAAALTLALGVGANVAVFAVVDAVLLRPLPYAGADRLVILNHRDQRTGFTKPFIALGDYVDMAERQKVFASMAAYSNVQATIYGPDGPYRVPALLAGPGLLEVLQVRAVAGRGLNAADSRDSAAAVIMIGYKLWQDRFGGDPAVIGRSVKIGRQQATIVGVAPAGFSFPPTANTDVIAPMSLPLQAPAARAADWTLALARLRPGQTAASATSALGAIAKQLEQEHPDQNEGSTYYADSLRDSLVGSTRTALMLLLAAVGVVLLIACANVANLQLARSLGRRRELAVRMVLGAGRARLAALLLTESFALAVVASIAGIIAAHWGVRTLVALMPASVQVPGLHDVRMNGAVLSFALAMAVVTALFFGAVATMTLRLESAADTLASAGRATMSRLARRALGGLVVAEVALAVVLLLGAGLILRSFAGLLSVDPGFHYDDVLTLTVQLPGDRYRSPQALSAFWSRAFEQLRATPAVQEMGAAVVVPLTGNNWTAPFERADQPVAQGQRPPDVGWQVASGGFFRTLGIPLLSGRLFDEHDIPDGKPVVIVSEAIEKRFFPGESAIGRQLKMGQQNAEIVGVVGNIRRAGLDDQPRADLYMPFERSPSNQITLFVKTAGDPGRAAGALRASMRSLEPNTSFLNVQSLGDIASQSIRVTQLLLWLLGVFALCALALAAVGIYGVMSYVVRQRTREIGTRMAVGATRRDIVMLVMRQGGLVAAIGIGAGLLAGVAATRSLRSVLFGVSTTDPATLLLATAVLAVTILTACYVPARRASAVDPARTLGQQ